MREITVTTKVYPFDELSDKAKETAIEELAYINVEHDWWDSTYEDAKTIGLTIEEFDLNYSRHAIGKWTKDAKDVARLIVENYGKQCEMYKTVIQYQTDRNTLVTKYSDGVHTDGVHDFDQDCDELDEDFLRNILEDYSLILQKETEYLQSEEAIIETIEANKYEFTEDGKLY